MGAHALITLAAYAVRDTMLRGLVALTAADGGPGGGEGGWARRASAGGAAGDAPPFDDQKTDSVDVERAAAVVAAAEAAEDAAVAARARVLLPTTDAVLPADASSCGVCWDAPPCLVAPCGHSLCTECALGLAAADRRPPRCPFCRCEAVAWRVLGGALAGTGCECGGGGVGV